MPCSGTAPRRIFFLERRDTIGTWTRSLPVSMFFVTPAGKTSTQVCHASSQFPSWSCDNANLAFPAQLNMGDLLVWAHQVRAQEDAAWREANPPTPQPCYEKQLDVRYDYEKVTICPPPIPGALKPKTPRL